MKEKSLIILPGQENKDPQLEYLQDRVVMGEMAMAEAVEAIRALGAWYASKKSRSSTMCDTAMRKAMRAGDMLYKYLQEYGVKQK